MYCEKQRASAPLSIASPATEQLGRATSSRPAAAASALIAFGVMSGVPTIFSAARLSRTVLRPAAPTAIDAMPKTMRTTLAAMPAYRRYLLMMSLLQRRFLRTTSLHRLSGPGPSGRTAAPGAARPHGSCGEPASVSEQFEVSRDRHRRAVADVDGDGVARARWVGEALGGVVDGREVRRQPVAGDLARRPPQAVLGGLALAAAAREVLVHPEVASAGQQAPAQDGHEGPGLDGGAGARGDVVDDGVGLLGGGPALLDRAGGGGGRRVDGGPGAGGPGPV